VCSLKREEAILVLKELFENALFLMDVIWH